MNSGYHKNLVFTAACIGMCFFGVSMITLGSVLPSLVTKLELSGLQTTSLVTFLPIGMLAGSLIFGPIADRFGHKALLVPSCIIVLSGLEGLIFFESIPLLQISIEPSGRAAEASLTNSVRRHSFTTCASSSVKPVFSANCTLMEPLRR